MRNRALVYCFCVFVLEIFCFLNAYIYDLKGASIDSLRFQSKAESWLYDGELSFVIGAEFYIQFLGIIYSIIGVGEFFASQFGILCLVLAAYYFERLLKLFDVKSPYLWVPVFLLWPSLVTRATTTMREPYLILFSVLMVYFVVLYIRDRRISSALIAIMAAFFAALFHKAYCVFFVFFVPYVLFVVLRQRARFYKSKVFYVRLAFVCLLSFASGYVYLNFLEVRGLQPVLALLFGDTETMQAVVGSKSAREFRTTYDATIDFTSMWAVLYSFPVVVGYYMFAPFLWTVGNAYDLYATFEGGARAISLVIMCWLFYVFKEERKYLIPIFVVLCLLAIIWASGTTNYGTASRHHLTTNCMFMVFLAIFLRGRNGQQN